MTRGARSARAKLACAPCRGRTPDIGYSSGDGSFEHKHPVSRSHGVRLHRVTANQTLLVAWNQSFTSDSTVIPVSAAGLAADHAVVGSECYGCHKSLDPLRTFWANQFDYDDRNDFAAASFGANPKSTRPTTTGGTLAFGSVNASGTSLTDLGNLLAGAVDSNGDPVQRFAISFAQKLCYLADSAACAEDDPEFRRMAKAFKTRSSTSRPWFAS